MLQIKLVVVGAHNSCLWTPLWHQYRAWHPSSRAGPVGGSLSYHHGLCLERSWELFTPSSETPSAELPDPGGHPLCLPGPPHIGPAGPGA